jgi:hypothetical protein
MSLPGPNRRPTDRISKRKPASEEAEPVVAVSPSKRSPVAPSQKLPSSSAPLKKADPTPSAKTVTSKTSDKTAEKKTSEKLPVSSISKRQPVVPATEVKKTSAKIPVAESTPAKAASTRRSSTMETTIVKPNIVSTSSRKTAPTAELPIEPLKSSTKRARSGDSSQKSGRTSSRAPQRKKLTQKDFNIIYYVLGAIFVALLLLILSSKMSGGPGKVIKVENVLYQGIDKITQAKKIYRDTPEKSAEGILIAEEGMTLMQNYLDPLRDANRDLPVNLRGYEQQLIDGNNLLKMLRNQKLLNEAQKERGNK